MSARILWLRCDSGRVIGATSDDILLLCELLESPANLRRQVRPMRFSTLHPKGLCLMRPVGLHVVLPASLAEWIADVARRTDTEIGDLRDRLESWLAGDFETGCRATLDVGVTGHSSTDF